MQLVGPLRTLPPGVTDPIVQGLIRGPRVGTLGRIHKGIKIPLFEVMCKVEGKFIFIIRLKSSDGL